MFRVCLDDWLKKEHDKPQRWQMPILWEYQALLCFIVDNIDYRKSEAVATDLSIRVSFISCPSMVYLLEILSLNTPSNFNFSILL